MKKLFAQFALSTIVFMLGSLSVSAAEFKMGENVLLDETTAGDNYIVGGNVTIQADTNGDLLVAGGQVTINGNVANDTVIAGGKVNIMGNINGDLRVIGGQVAVYGNVAEDLIVSGGQVDVGKNSVISGDIFAGAGVISIDGKVTKGVHGVIGTLLLNGSVGEDVIINVQDEMQIAKSAKIGGSLNYTSMLQSDVPAGVVTGQVNFNKFEAEGAKEGLLYMYIAERIWSFAGVLVLALIVSFMVPNLLKRAPEVTRENVLKSFGIGLLTMICLFVGALILFTTIIGIPLALIVLAGALVATYMSKIFAALFLSSYLFKINKASSSIKLFGMLTVGVTIYYLLGMIPVLGWVFDFVILLIGLGTIVSLKLSIFAHLRSKKLV